MDERLCPLHVHTNPRDRRTLLRDTDTVTPAQAQSGRSHGPQRLNATQEAANRAEGDRKAGATSNTYSWGASQVGGVRTAMLGAQRSLTGRHGSGAAVSPAPKAVLDAPRLSRDATG